jgi:hypothetical protein
MKRPLIKTLSVFLTLMLGIPHGLMAQSASESPQKVVTQSAAGKPQSVKAPQEANAPDTAAEKPFKQEELDQMLAPIALYPDSLLAQIFMASTYPLELVQAEKWIKKNQNLKGDELAKALEEENWDPSVKSMVNFPQVLEMMTEKLEWTQNLGDAFLAQQKETLDTVQKLRKKAEEHGNLKDTKEQKVTVEETTQTIVIESEDPEVIYVPYYNPTVVYGSWWYPTYPPYYYYPPGYAATGAFFAFSVGVAWGYAWGHCNWHGGDIDIDINRNRDVNRNIDRDKYKDRVSTGKEGRGNWKHNPEHRKGVSYRDQTTAQKFDRGATRDQKSREAFRGRAEAGRQDIARGGADQYRDRTGSSIDRSGGSRTDRAASSQRAGRSAFSGYDSGNRTRNYSSRGHQSMSSSRAGGGFSRGGSGMSRGGGGGRRR